MQSSRLSLLTLLLAACTAHDGDDPDPTPEPPAPPAFVEAAHPAPAQMISLGGPVLAAPKIQAIFFANDGDVQTQIEAFMTQLAASTYWRDTTSEYGVGPLTILPTIVETGAPPTTDAELTALLQKIPSPDPSTMYSVFLPAGVVLTSPDGETSCASYGAFHDEAVGTHGEKIVYALMPRCTADGVAPLDLLTLAASHEWVEGAADPYVRTAAAFQGVDADHAVWAVHPGAEIADFCEDNASAFARLVGDFAVQRTWSNAAARAGTDPCVPAPPNPYVAAAPALGERVRLAVPELGLDVATLGIDLAIGASKTIDVPLYSDAASDAFEVTALDLAAALGDPAELELKLDKTTGVNGDTLHLTVTRKTATEGGSVLVLYTQLGDRMGSVQYGFVGNGGSATARRQAAAPRAHRFGAFRR